MHLLKKMRHLLRKMPLEAWDEEIKHIFAALCYEVVVTSKEMKEEGAGQFALLEKGPRSQPNMDPPRFENAAAEGNDDSGKSAAVDEDGAQAPPPPSLAASRC